MLERRHGRFILPLLFASTTLVLVASGIYSWREISLLPVEAVGLRNAALILTGMSFGVTAALFAIAMAFRRGRQRQLEAQADAHRFLALVQRSGDLIAISDVDRKLKYLNPSGCAMVGLEGHFVEGIDGTRFYSSEFNERMQSEVIPAVKAHGAWSGEFCYQHFGTKELVPVFMNVFPLHDTQTNRYLGMAVVSRDIRDRKKLEKQLNRFFEVSLDMLGIADTRGYFLRLNPAFSEVLGYTEQELCSRPATDFIHPDDIAGTIEQIKLQSQGQSVISFENRYRTKSGEYRWLSWKSSPDGELTYGAARDITEEKKQKARMEELSQNAIAASRAKSEFLANMSHEIRTPINGVVGMTGLLLESQLNSKQQEYAEHIMTSAQSLLSVINDILDFSKIEAGKLDFETVDFSLENLVEETAKAMEWSLRSKGLSLEMDFALSPDGGSGAGAPIPGLWRGDPGRIRQVLTNLLGNAIKFTAVGSITLAVRVLQSKAGSAPVIRFSVKDTGIGLSKAAQEKIFQAFSQADASTSRKFGGSGLGLSISKRLVQLMGGEIGVQSVEGQGSTFWFTLPLERAAGRFEKKAGPVIPTTRFKEARILVAEDNVINQKIALAMLDKIGFKVHAVSDGNEVLAALQEHAFDLILMDCQMPELDGYSATRRIRENPAFGGRDLPIVAMTANALKGDREKCLEAGMDDYVSKPVTMSQLASAIEVQLERAARKKKTSA